MIRSVEMHRLRGIRDGELTELTPLVVLVGPNGSGKSTVLDALFIGATPNVPDAVGRVVQRRRGGNRGARWLIWRATTEEPASIRVTGDDSGLFREIALSLDPRFIGTGESTKLLCQVFEGHQVNGVVTSREFVTEGPVDFINSSNAYNSTLTKPAGQLRDIADVRLLDSREPESKEPLYRLFTRAVEQGRRSEALSIIRDVIPNVSSIEILTEGDSPILHLVFDDHSVPVGLAGDGIQTLLRQCLEFASCRHGVVLLEEPEVHEHPAAILQSARVIFAAVRRGIQVVLTTHSIELIDSLVSEAGTDAELESMSVYRIQLDGGELRSSRLSGAEVAFARTTIEDDLR